MPPPPLLAGGRGWVSALTMRPQEHRWGLSHLGHWQRPFQKVGEKGARRQGIMVPPEKGKELVWFHWYVGRGEVGPASKAS